MKTVKCLVELFDGRRTHAVGDIVDVVDIRYFEWKKLGFVTTDLGNTEPEVEPKPAKPKKVAKKVANQ